jgi:hypothetical protein
MINIEKSKSILQTDITILKQNSCKNVFWNCPICNKEYLKKYRDALKYKKCLNCSNFENANKNKELRNKKIKEWHKNNAHPLLGKKRPQHVLEA